jgi:hypothetical protein
VQSEVKGLHITSEEIAPEIKKCKNANGRLKMKKAHQHNIKATVKLSFYTLFYNKRHLCSIQILVPL